jgi:hypothetical protein
MENLDIKKIQTTPKVTENNKLDKIQIPTTEELETLKKDDLEEYLYWIDVISKADQIKHEEEMQQIGEELDMDRRKRLEELYKNKTKEERRHSYLYGQD